MTWHRMKNCKAADVGFRAWDPLEWEEGMRWRFLPARQILPNRGLVSRDSVKHRIPLPPAAYVCHYHAGFQEGVWLYKCLTVAVATRGSASAGLGTHGCSQVSMDQFRY